MSWVEVIDDGSGRETPADSDRLFDPVSGSVTNPDLGGAENVGVPVQVPSGAPVVHRRNRSLWAAWVLVAFALVVGLGWLFGLLPSQWDGNVWAADGSFSSAAETSWLSLEMQMNLSMAGPYLVFVGLLGAIILLALQAVIFRRDPRTD
ncbi:hypothetical protein MUG94_03520 [Arthrobacter gengyunqii]|uniref:Uncharacterized protein n=1 Tax=Arthrobacter gengyunqii TaxID=2886940 RepID=A0A9X1M3A1_9MICC|nr:hypothetical protein [Arthrobacter gengyunqii]MCC3270152.1 hypothetical protein [Arthrobacter gengyunqii]UOY96857.1 hypothetical protein MUG94_03520 [Arthrobacter gengyunqii]